jgi:hypothetical protein
MRDVLPELALPYPVKDKKLDPDALKSFLYLRVMQDSQAKPKAQAFTAITSRYSDETTVSSSLPRLCADHNTSSSAAQPKSEPSLRQQAGHSFGHALAIMVGHITILNCCYTQNRRLFGCNRSTPRAIRKKPSLLDFLEESSVLGTPKSEAYTKLLRQPTLEIRWRSSLRFKKRSNVPSFLLTSSKTVFWLESLGRAQINLRQHYALIR